MMEKLRNAFNRAKPQKPPAGDDERPVKFVPEGDNSWRVVYAD